MAVVGNPNAISQAVKKVAAAPRAMYTGVGVQHPIGYGGPGWTYPSTAANNNLVRYSPTAAHPTLVTNTVDPMSYVNAMPDVQNAKLDLSTQGAQADTAYRQGMGQLLAYFGDPTMLPGYSGQSLQDMLGSNIDPAWLALARANTMGPDNTFGNSQVAQLYLAAQKAKQQAINEGFRGFVNSGQVGYNVNQANIDYGNSLFNALNTNFLTPAQKLVSDWTTTKQNLTDAVQKAINTDLATVLADPTKYPTTTATSVKGPVSANPIKPVKIPAAPVINPNINTGTGYTGGGSMGGWNYPVNPKATNPTARLNITSGYGTGSMNGWGYS